MPDASTPRHTPLRWRITALRVTFLLFLPLALFTTPAWNGDGIPLELAENIGVLLIIFAVLGRFWSILYSGGRKNAVVVQDGPYSICRHPLYLFSAMGIVGFGLMLGSFILTGLLGGVMIATLVVTARLEESNLEAALPGYDAYRARVPMLLPDLSLYRSPERIQINVTTLRGNLRDALVFLSLLPIAEILESIAQAHLWPQIAIW